MKKSKPLPDPLLDARPALADDPLAQHPTNGESLGKPPAKYTLALHNDICERIKRFQRPVVAAQQAGITAATFYEWMKRGKAGDPHLYEFANDVEHAMSVAEGNAVDGVMNHPDAKPEDLKWWLERSRPDGYSKDVAQRVQAELENFMKRLEAGLDPATFEKVLGVFAGQPVTPALTAKPKPDDDDEENE